MHTLNILLHFLHAYACRDPDATELRLPFHGRHVIIQNPYAPNFFFFFKKKRENPLPS